jgi:Na+/H+-translocating membrane pyrophosphatase
MIEFGLILGAGALAVGIAILLGFPLLTRATRLRLITSANAPLSATSRSYLRIHDRSLVVLTGLVAFAVFVGFGIVRELRPNDPSSSPLALAGWLVAALLLGALSSTGAIHLTAHALNRAATRFGDATKADSSCAIRAGVRWAGAAALASVALMILAISFLFLALALSGNAGVAPTPAPFHAVASLLPAYALGTVVSSIVAHSIGGVFVSASTALPCAPGRPCLVHLHLDVPVTRVADTLSSLSTVLAATTAICASAPNSASSLPFAPLVAGALGLLAATVGILVVRSDTSEAGARPLDRGLWVTLALNAAIFAGLSHWLFGQEGWRVAMASAIGLLGAVVMLWSDRWSPPAHRRSAHRTLARWGANLERVALLGVVVAAVATGGHLLGRSGGEERAGVGLAFAVLGLIAPAPFLLAVAAFGAMARCHLKSVGSVAGACEQQLASSVDAGRGLRAHASACAILAGWVACAAFAERTLPDAMAWDSRGVLTALCAALLGGVLVAWQIGASLRALAATLSVLARLASETPTSQPSVLAPHVGASLQESARQGIPSLVLLTTVPALLWAVLFWTTRPGVVAVATVATVLGASLVGLLLSLSASFASEPSIDFHRTSPPGDKPVDVGDKWANNAPVSAPDEGDTLGRPLQSLVGPCIHASVKLLATAALALAALFF